nr:class D sortase [Pseudalkalibacillus decolorationis]
MVLAFGVIGLGIWFTGTNAYKLITGYTLYKIEQKMDTTDPVIAEKRTDVKRNSEPVVYKTRPEKGENIGELHIPKLNATLPIIHGTEEENLEKGVGHFAGSVLPGEDNNSVLSGHRDTVFRRLGEVGKGDELRVSTSAGTFVYKIRKVRIVDADDRTVIVPKPKATLTVTTCYPFTFVGAAPERYVLVANLVKHNGES